MIKVRLKLANRICAFYRDFSLKLKPSNKYSENSTLQARGRVGGRARGRLGVGPLVAEQTFSHLVPSFLVGDHRRHLETIEMIDRHFRLLPILTIN